MFTPRSKYDLEHNSGAWWNANMNRRQILALPAALSLVEAVVWGDGEQISRSAESIRQEPVFQASRKRVYEALTNAKQFERIVQLSGATQAMGLAKTPAEISPVVGGAFSLFGGHISGRHVELVPNERLVQAWRAADWDAGVYSIARFALVEQGSGTKIVFDHTGFPVGQAQHLAEGWHANYWTPLGKFLAG
jgi:activator of HSP90 ATPase